MSSRGAVVAVLLAAGLGAGAGCGTSGDENASAPAPAISTGVAAPPAPTASTPDQLGVAEPETVTTPSTTSTPATPSTTATEPDAGDEEGIRVPATFALSEGALSPPQITVPPQLPIAVTVTAADGKAHTVVFSTEPPATVEVPAGGQGTVSIPGQRKGTYTASIDGAAPIPALVAIDDAGP